jgi:hypothetical protein
MIYLASPYSHPDPAVRQDRFERVCKVAARMMERGEVVFSPIAHTHPIAMKGNLPTDWEYWKKVDEEFIKACSKLGVLMLDGWEDSEGIEEEMKLARSVGKQIIFIEENA